MLTPGQHAWPMPPHGVVTVMQRVAQMRLALFLASAGSNTLRKERWRSVGAPVKAKHTSFFDLHHGGERGPRTPGAGKSTTGEFWGEGAGRAG